MQSLMILFGDHCSQLLLTITCGSKTCVFDRQNESLSPQEEKKPKILFRTIPRLECKSFIPHFCSLLECAFATATIKAETQAAQKRWKISVPRGLQDPTGQNLQQSGVNWVLTHLCAGGWTAALPRAIPTGRIHRRPGKSQCGTKHSVISYLLCFQSC